MELLKECIACMMSNQIQIMGKLGVDDKESFTMCMITSKLRDEISPVIRKDVESENEETRKAVNMMDVMLEIIEKYEKVMKGLR